VLEIGSGRGWMLRASIKEHGPRQPQDKFVISFRESMGTPWILDGNSVVSEQDHIMSVDLRQFEKRSLAVSCG
jgi:hypothetical protein